MNSLARAQLAKALDECRGMLHAVRDVRTSTAAVCKVHRTGPFVGPFQKSSFRDFSGNLGPKLTNGSKNMPKSPKASSGMPFVICKVRGMLHAVRVVRTSTAAICKVSLLYARSRRPTFRLQRSSAPLCLN